MNQGGSWIQAWLGRKDRQSFAEIRLHFGSWLALEFQLGADIVATTIAPSFEALVKLALIALVRTFLNDFLQRELEAGTAERPRTLDVD